MPAPDETDDDAVAADVVVPGTGRPSRSATRIVVAVLVAAAVLAGLALWVLAVPYRSDVDGFGGSFDCDARVDWTDDGAGRAARASFERSCDDAEEDRRDTALLVGAGVAIAACAVSTIPSRRLSGEQLGPLR